MKIRRAYFHDYAAARQTAAVPVLAFQAGADCHLLPTGQQVRVAEKPGLDLSPRQRRRRLKAARRTQKLSPVTP